MAQSVKEIKIKDASAPLIYEESIYIPIVSMQLVFQNSGHLSNTKDGLADMSARILNEGTKKEGSVGFATTLDEHAIEVGAQAGRENFVIEISALKSEFAFAVERVKALLGDPNYTQETLAHVKRQKTGWLMQKKSDFDYIAAAKLREILFKDSPLGKPYDGTMQSIESITLEDIEEFIASHLGCNNVVVVAGGDITLQEAETYTKEILSLLPKVNTVQIDKIKASDQKQTVLAKEETQQAYIHFGAPFAYDYNQTDEYKVKIAEYLLGGAGFGSRLMEEIRVKRGLTYGVYASLRRTKTASYLSGYLQTKLSTQEEAKNLVQQVVNEFVNEGITQKELDDTKKFLLGSEPLRTETLSQRLNRAFEEFYYGRPLGFTKDQLEKIEKVTLEEINIFIEEHKELMDLSFGIVTKDAKNKN
ncbi:MAG TPA: peptidase M16 [Sulfurovum sp. UBA12169]|nr:MAG TPA: peptidase M16 [Sulfurovum sp. UBA12169]